MYNYAHSNNFTVINNYVENMYVLTFCFYQHHYRQDIVS